MTLLERPSYTRLSTREFKYTAKGRINVYVPKPLLRQLIAEAQRRGWPLSRLVVHLCKTSLEGTE